MNRDAPLTTGYRPIEPGMYLGHIWQVKSEEVKSRKSGKMYTRWRIRVRISRNDSNTPLTRSVRMWSRFMFSDSVVVLCKILKASRTEEGTGLPGLPCKVSVKEFTREVKSEVLDMTPEGQVKTDDSGNPVYVMDKAKSIGIEGFLAWPDGKKMSELEMEQKDEIEETAPTESSDEEEDLPF